MKKHLGLPFMLFIVPNFSPDLTLTFTNPKSLVNKPTEVQRNVLIQHTKLNRFIIIKQIVRWIRGFLKAKMIN